MKTLMIDEEPLVDIEDWLLSAYPDKTAKLIHLLEQGFPSSVIKFVTL